jgi:Protein of unknown function (DUF3800)
MFVFLDESGDPGMNLETGSSAFFVVTAVTFQEEEHIEECASKIEAVRKELRLPGGLEFKFAKCSDSWREAFLQSVSGCSFFYRAIVINKRALSEGQFGTDAGAFYEYVVSLTLDLWRPYLLGATVDIDKSGGESFSRVLCRHVEKNFKDRNGKPLLKRVRAVDSAASDMIQLADMVCGAIARSFKQKDRKRGRFRKLIRFRETEVIERP